MVSYSDGVNAKYWKTKTQIKKVETALKKLEHVFQNQNVKLNITKIDDIEIGYWDEGVHYYKPVIGTSINKLINRLSKPAKNIYVVGEIISKKQGWVEGAIESVNRII